MISRRDVYDEDGLALCDAFAGYLSLALQKAALREHARHLEELTVIDGLTGVPNRRAFDAALEREWTRAIRAKKPIADRAARHRSRSRLYNDAYGHPQGDACLRQIARACKASVVRATDCFARYGGEEFGVVIPDAEARCAAKVAERLRAAVESLAIPHESAPRGIVTVSVGVASIVPKRGAHYRELRRNRRSRALPREGHRPRSRRRRRSVRFGYVRTPGVAAAHAEQLARRERDADRPRRRPRARRRSARTVPRRHAARCGRRRKDAALARCRAPAARALSRRRVARRTGAARR